MPELLWKVLFLSNTLKESRNLRRLLNRLIIKLSIIVCVCVWQAYIDFEIAEGELERTWASYERLLDRTKHYKVWVSFAKFEASAAEQEEDEKEEEEIDAIERKKECIRRTRGNFELHVVT